MESASSLETNKFAIYFSIHDGLLSISLSKKEQTK